MTARHQDKKEDQGHEALCPQCGRPSMETVEVEETFDHGGRKKPIHVTAVLPSKQCRDCNFSFEDWETEEARHRAACVQVGVQTPVEIRSLRQAYGLSQKDFAHLTRLGAATLNRWERGHLIQNGAYDDYLYLLRFPENLERLKTRRSSAQGPDSKRFQCLQPTPELRRQASQFQLTPATQWTVADENGERRKATAEAKVEPVSE